MSSWFKFLRHLQELEESAKNRWLWLASLSVFSLIFLAWLVYMYSALPQIASSNSVFKKSDSNSNQISFVAATTSGLALTLNYFSNLITSRHEIIINNNEADRIDPVYIPDNITSITPRSFPILN